jgi:hypothetical protein
MPFDICQGAAALSDRTGQAKTGDFDRMFEGLKKLTDYFFKAAEVSALVSI